MSEGIRFENVSLEVSEAGVEGLLSGGTAEVTVHRLEASVSEAALNRLLERVAPEGQPAPRARLAAGEATVEGRLPGLPAAAKVQLRIGALRLELEDGALRLRSE